MSTIPLLAPHRVGHKKKQKNMEGAGRYSWKMSFDPAKQSQVFVWGGGRGVKGENCSSLRTIPGHFSNIRERPSAVSDFEYFHQLDIQVIWEHTLWVVSCRRGCCPRASPRSKNSLLVSWSDCWRKGDGLLSSLSLLKGSLLCSNRGLVSLESPFLEL